MEDGTVTVVILSDTDSATHVFSCSKPQALSMVELMSGYRRMLEAYVKMPALGEESIFLPPLELKLSSSVLEYPVYPVVPHPALYAKPVKRKKLQRENSRVALFKEQYLKLCLERKTAPYLPFVRQLDHSIDTATPLEKLSFARYRWKRADYALVFDAMIAAKPYTYRDDEDFVENMSLKMLDFTDTNVLEKGFFGDLDGYFGDIGKHPYELKGISFRNCRLDDKAISALKPAISKLKKLETADFAKNPVKEGGVHSIILAVRDANPSFTELDLSGCTLKVSRLF